MAGANIHNQICGSPGAVAGSAVVTGSQLAAYYGYEFSHRWRNVGIIISIAVIYALLGALGSEIMTFVPQGGAPIIFTKQGRKREQVKDNNNSDPEREASSYASSDSNLAEDLKTDVLSSGRHLTWRNISVNIGEKNILRNLSGHAGPGDFIALCGPSGAGKTTLLRALSNTNFSGELVGDVKFGGAVPSHNFRKATGITL